MLIREIGSPAVADNRRNDETVSNKDLIFLFVRFAFLLDEFESSGALNRSAVNLVQLPMHCQTLSDET